MIEGTPGFLPWSEDPDPWDRWTDEDFSEMRRRMRRHFHDAFREDLHPRDEDGKWTSGGGGSDKIVVRPVGWQAGSDDVAKMTRPGHLYRGMSEAEYVATVGAGKGVQSNLSSSIKSVEGTNFSKRAEDAESYANFGTTDPRKTGTPNYLVEVKAGDNLQAKPDGYYHIQGELPRSQITRVWKMEAQGGAVVATPINIDAPLAGEEVEYPWDKVMTREELKRFNEMEERYKELNEAEKVEYTELAEKFEKRWQMANAKQDEQRRLTETEWVAKQLHRHASKVANDLGFDPERIKVVSGTRTFDVNGVTHNAGGDADIYNTMGNGNIRLYQDHLTANTISGVTAHEIEHFKFQEAIVAYRKDFDRLRLEHGPAPDPNHQYYWGKRGGFDAVQTPSGELREAYKEKYPDYDRIHKAMFMPLTQDFAEGDGVSRYSAEYWKAFKDGKVSFELAMHETLAEMARFKYTTGKFPPHFGYSAIINERLQAESTEKSQNVDFPPKPPAAQKAKGEKVWRNLYRVVDQMWKGRKT